MDHGFKIGDQLSVTFNLSVNFYVTGFVGDNGNDSETPSSFIKGLLYFKEHLSQVVLHYSVLTPQKKTRVSVGLI